MLFFFFFPYVVVSAQLQSTKKGSHSYLMGDGDGPGKVRKITEEMTDNVAAFVRYCHDWPNRELWRLRGVAFVKQ